MLAGKLQRQVLLANPDRATVLTLLIITRVEMKPFTAALTLRGHGLIRGLPADDTHR